MRPSIDSIAPLLLLVAALCAGCAQRQGPPPECVELRGVAIQHSTEHYDGSQTPFRAVYDGTLVTTPAWVTATRYDSRQVRHGKRTWWLNGKEESVTDDEAAWTVARGE